MSQADGRAWHPLETLVRDGRQVEYRAPAGDFFGPAVVLRAPTRAEAVAMHQTDGSWPQKKFNATHWREI